MERREMREEVFTLIRGTLFLSIVYSSDSYSQTTIGWLSVVLATFIPALTLDECDHSQTPAASYFLCHALDHAPDSRNVWCGLINRDVQCTCWSLHEFASIVLWCFLLIKSLSSLFSSWQLVRCASERALSQQSLRTPRRQVIAVFLMSFLSFPNKWVIFLIIPLYLD